VQGPAAEVAVSSEARPRERYLAEGPVGFGEVELLALVLGTGTVGRPALEIAARALSDAGGLQRLARLDPAALARVPGMGPARAIRVHAALALGARATRRVGVPAPGVTTPAAAAALLVPRFAGLDAEELHALYLDRPGGAIAVRRLTCGSERFTVVEPRQILRVALEIGADGVILAHNHPSGDPTPSAQDRDVTRRVASAARAVGIRLVDHLVVAGERWTSLAEAGELPRWADEAPWVAAPG
jgi:DNA repair protein RadC